MKIYKFTMRTPSATICAILTRVYIANGVVQAIKVGENENERCEPIEFMAGGGPFILEELKCTTKYDDLK